ncbi:hypothetical protein H7X69_02405 [Candidatus Saccharibacteria bacterium]|nr:hypothetical protein [Candidatus Saccharibacteria bacterium]
MKKTIQESFTLLLANRRLLVLCGALLLLAFSFVVYIGFKVRPSDLQLVSHYSAFGVTHLYRDQWFYLWSFGLFGFFVAAIHVILTVKLFMVKGDSLAVAFAWLGIVVMLLAWATAFAVLNVWSPS